MLTISKFFFIEKKIKIYNGSWIFQALPKNDVTIKESIPDLLLEKHASYLMSYAENKDDYVSERSSNSLF